MARTSRPAIGQQQKGQKRKAIPKKAQPKAGQSLDVYEYNSKDAPGNKKANKRILGDAQEMNKGKGRAVIQNEGSDKEMERPAYILGGGSDVEFHSSQDEEIDSDMADTSGEEDDRPSGSKGKQKPKVSFARDMYESVLIQVHLRLTGAAAEA